MKTKSKKVKKAFYCLIAFLIVFYTYSMSVTYADTVDQTDTAAVQTVDNVDSVDSVDAEEPKSNEDDQDSAGETVDDEDADSALTVAESESASDNSARSRYVVLGGVALAICVAFYAFLCAKTKKGKKK